MKFLSRITVLAAFLLLVGVTAAAEADGGARDSQNAVAVNGKGQAFSASADRGQLGSWIKKKRAYEKLRAKNLHYKNRQYEGTLPGPTVTVVPEFDGSAAVLVMGLLLALVALGRELRRADLC